MKTYKKHTVYKLNDEGTSAGEPRYQWITDDNTPNQQIPLVVGNADYDCMVSEIKYTLLVSVLVQFERSVS